MRKLILMLTLIICFGDLVIAQVNTPVLSPALSPQIEWTSISWAPYKNDWSTLQTQDESGEDWLMDVIEYYEGGVHVGYAACGFSSWSDFLVYDNEYTDCAHFDAIDEFDAELFYTDSHQRGILRQTVGIYDLGGELINMWRYNIGTFFKIHQADNGDLVMTGDAFNPVPFNGETHMGEPMYVNPVAGSNPNGFLTYDLGNFDPGFCETSTPGRGTEFNVVRINSNDGNVEFNNFFNEGNSREESFFYKGGIGHGIADAGNGDLYIVGRLPDESDLNVSAPDLNHIS